MATIVTRAGKGSALTWTEGDANITNLNNDKIELTNLSVSTGSASSGGSLSYNNTTGEFTFAPADLSSVGGIADIVEDTTPQLGGSLDVNGNSIVSASNGNISITPDGTGSIILDGQSWPQADGTADQVLKTNGSGQLSWTTPSGGASGPTSNVTLYGVQFNSNTYLEDSTISSFFNNSKKAYTVSFWVKFNGLDDEGTIWASINTGTSTRYFRILLNRNYLYFWIPESGASVQYLYFVFDSTMSTGTWHHFNISWNRANGDYQFYINGENNNHTLGDYYDVYNGNTTDTAQNRVYMGRTYTDNSGQFHRMSLAQFFVDHRYYDISDPEVRKKFYWEGPVDMGADGTGTGLLQPMVFHYTTSGSYTTWYANRGTASYSYSSFGTNLTAVSGPTNGV